MKKFSVTAGLTAFLLSLVSLVAQARPAATQWWFQSAAEPEPEVSETKPEPPTNQPTLVTEVEPVPEPLTPGMQTHAPFDPRQLPHEPCPPCGMG
ncbi:hypothetical protein [Acaryochloris sp. CCMEE 5410]|uniref:hypothetical protein n=1 Tax=Acaryochloris sp. CCMEE 5410 TaxID=310037 RepID=UPI0002484945|nr:hypothetical protein [Acaryochloris sp. CCMEE 5410]KAI9131657.1 hypothetical protein ON05_029175 [Acaryochloris sp. CCMEE 5410]